MLHSAPPLKLLRLVSNKLQENTQYKKKGVKESDTEIETRHRLVEEAGVGENDVNADAGEDFERGLDMWKGMDHSSFISNELSFSVHITIGNTMEIAARLRQAEQERKELQRQLLNASHSSKSNSSK